VTVRKYVKRPIPIEAMQYTYDSWFKLIRWMDKHSQAYHLEQNGTLKLFTLEGWQICNPGSYVIRGVGGEFYSCQQDIFNVSYELYEDSVHYKLEDDGK
jgi:hypothetical protein